MRVLLETACILVLASLHYLRTQLAVSREDFQGRIGKIVSDLFMSKFTYWYICVLTEIIQICVNI